MAPEQPLGPREQLTEARGSGPAEGVSRLGRASAVPQRWCLCPAAGITRQPRMWKQLGWPAKKARNGGVLLLFLVFKREEIQCQLPLSVSRPRGRCGCSENREMRSLAFARNHRVQGRTGWGCAGVQGLCQLSPSPGPQPESFSLSQSPCLCLVPDPEAAVGLSLGCVLLQLKCFRQLSGACGAAVYAQEVTPLGRNRGFFLSGTALGRRASWCSAGEASPVPGFSQVSVVLSLAHLHRHGWGAADPYQLVAASLFSRQVTQELTQAVLSGGLVTHNFSKLPESWCV